MLTVDQLAVLLKYSVTVAFSPAAIVTAGAIPSTMHKHSSNAKNRLKWFVYFILFPPFFGQTAHQRPAQILPVSYLIFYRKSVETMRIVKKWYKRTAEKPAFKWPQKVRQIFLTQIVQATKGRLNNVISRQGIYRTDGAEEHHDTLQTGVLQNASPDGVANFMIFGIENHKISSHDDLHINTFNPTD